ncbi:MAG: RHS repeat-associated core domain-containing protein [Fimbriimonas sp.]|nr:RHS repeat-associated core domain-containing protein [Fimbriimonas sp.]
MPSNHYTSLPLIAFLGHHPGRDVGRGIWSKEALANAQASSIGTYASTDPEDMLVGHTVAVSPAPGPPLPWEGALSNGSWQGRILVPDHSIVNTANGDRLFVLKLLGWKSRGINVDFTLYHNSETNFSDEFGYGWSSSTDVYINNLTSTPTLHWATGLSIPYSGTGPTYTPPAGYYDQMVHNGDGTWTVTAKNGTKYEFNGAGFCTAIQDLDGNQLTFVLNSSNYCTQIIDPTGKSISINLDSSNHVSSIVDALNRRWSFELDGNGDLSRVNWPIQSDGIVYNDSFTYSRNRIASHTDKRGCVWQASYNSDGSIATSIDPLGHSVTYGYSTSATVVVDPMSNSLTDNYSNGILASRKDQAGFSVSYRLRDSNYNILTLVDKNGSTWHGTYDPHGNLLSITDPLSHVTTWTYNSLAEELTQTDALANVQTYTYSPSGHLLTTTDPLSHTLRVNTYDQFGELMSQSDALGNTIRLTYDTSGNCTTIEDPLSNTTELTFDALNRLISIQDTLGDDYSVSYDPWDREITFTNPDGSATTRSYDTEGDLLSETDENSHTASFTYDTAQRLLTATNARSDTEAYIYDPCNNKIGVTDGNGHFRSYAYTNRGELAAMTLADGATEAWAYDGNGNTTVYENPIRQSILYSYDFANRPTGATYPTGPGTSYTYDNSDRLLTMSDSTGITAWTYDQASRVTNLNTPQGSIGYTYDNAGNRLTMSDVAGTTSYAYDADSNVVSIKNPFSESTSFGYDADGRLIKETFASGAYDQFGYDNRDRTVSLTHRNSAGSILSQDSYSYDAASNIISKTVDTLTTNYTYDPVDQLLSENNAGYSASYSYDSNGNRTSSSIQGVTYAYIYDSGDKLTSIKAGSSTIKSYLYDAAGRTTSVTTSSGTTYLSYDYEDRVVGITYPNSTTNSFTYNGLDTRIAKADSSGMHNYRRDGIGVTDPVLSDGTITFTPGISERLGTTTIFDHSDQLGSFTRQTNSVQSTTATRTFDAFGNLLSTTGQPQSTFGFAGTSGYQQDTDSGLMLLGHRFYDPASGRFITRDSAKDGRNWYAYCYNNPVAHVDPDGHIVPLVVIAILAIGILAAGTAEAPTSGHSHSNAGQNGARKIQVALDVTGAVSGIGDLIGGIAGIIEGSGAAIEAEAGGAAEEVGSASSSEAGVYKGAIEKNHKLPRAIKKQLRKEQYPRKPDARVGLPRDWHQGPEGIHGGNGYKHPGGHYNNWWHDSIDQHGGFHEIPQKKVQELYDEIGDLLGW